MYKIITISDPILYEQSETVVSFDRSLRSLVSGMFETMYHEDGVGLAAVQIGILKRVFVIDLRGENTRETFINPQLLDSSDEMQEGEEGCLSVPGIAVILKRPQWVKVSYQNVLGESKKIVAEDLMARALLHEMDHLDGKIYVDLLEPHIKKEIQSDLDCIRSGKKIKNTQVPAYRRR